MKKQRLGLGSLWYGKGSSINGVTVLKTRKDGGGESTIVQNCTNSSRDDNLEPSEKGRLGLDRG